MSILNIIQQEPSPERVVEAVTDVQAAVEVEKRLDEYNGNHVVVEKQKDELIGKPLNKRLKQRNRLILNYQKKIVNSAVSFLLGEPVQLSIGNQEFRDTYADAFRELKRVWTENRLEHFNRDLARRVFVESRAAELWFITEEPGGSFVIKPMLLSESTGNKIFPHFDEVGRMIAFARKFKAENDSGNVVEQVEVYTDNLRIRFMNDDGWKLKGTEVNVFGKIPVVYYEQEDAEWADVQSLIDRSELLLSRFADTVDYFGAPLLKLYGSIIDPPEKEEVGKMLRFKQIKNATGSADYGDAEYLTWDQSPESIKLEFEILKEQIHSMTSTPDLSFNNLKGVGQVTGPVLRFMFLDSLLKTKEKQKVFGQGFARRNNILKSMLQAVNVANRERFAGLEVSVAFQNPLPDNEREMIENLSLATGGQPIMSTETAIDNNPLVGDTAAEKQRIEQEQGQKQNKEQIKNGEFAAKPE